MFTKSPSCLTGPGHRGRAARRRPHRLGGRAGRGHRPPRVPGRPTRRLGPRRRADASGQDLSERDPADAGPSPQFSLGKSLPGFGPTGPWLVTPDEFADPDDLELGCSVNGDQMQKGRTRDLIFSVPALIAQLSRGCPLLPGDVIFTGTPAGVGLGRTPPVWLAAGDELVSYIDGIGELRQRFVAATDRLRLLSTRKADRHGPAPPHPDHHRRAQRRADRRLLRRVRPHRRRGRHVRHRRRRRAAAHRARRHRRLVELGVGADDPDDLDRVAASLAALGVPAERTRRRRPRRRPRHRGRRARSRSRPGSSRNPPRRHGYNGPGVDRRPAQRAPGILRERAGPAAQARPRRVRLHRPAGHHRSSSPRASASRSATRSRARGAFMRCSTDHHNVLVQQAPGRLPAPHLVAGRRRRRGRPRRQRDAGRTDPERHVWGLGRHHVGSNFFWYLKDPAGNFSEYYSDMDCIVDDALWTAGGAGRAPRACTAGGRRRRRRSSQPEDLAALMTGAHSRS